MALESTQPTGTASLSPGRQRSRPAGWRDSVPSALLQSVASARLPQLHHVMPLQAAAPPPGPPAQHVQLLHGTRALVAVHEPRHDVLQPRLELRLLLVAHGSGHRSTHCGRRCCGWLGAAAAVAAAGTAAAGLGGQPCGGGGGRRCACFAVGRRWPYQARLAERLEVQRDVGKDNGLGIGVAARDGCGVTIDVIALWSRWGGRGEGGGWRVLEGRSAQRCPVCCMSLALMREHRRATPQCGCSVFCSPSGPTSQQGPAQRLKLYKPGSVPSAPASCTARAGWSSPCAAACRPRRSACGSRPPPGTGRSRGC